MVGSLIGRWCVMCFACIMCVCVCGEKEHIHVQYECVWDGVGLPEKGQTHTNQAMKTHQGQGQHKRKGIEKMCRLSKVLECSEMWL